MPRTDAEIKAAARAAGNPAAIAATQPKDRKGRGFARAALSLMQRQQAWKQGAFQSTEAAQGKDVYEGGELNRQTVKQIRKMIPVKERAAEIESSQERDIAAMESAEAKRAETAQAESAEMKAGQVKAMEGFDVADQKAEQGLEEIRASIGETRESLEKMPEEVRQEFDFQAQRLDATLAQARVGLDAQRSEALSNVMAGQSAALQAATQTIHGQARAQKSQIDAMLQQGQISPSQAAAMKAKVGLSASMSLAPAIGQTIHAFTQTQAQVATSFGNMFTSMESVGAQTTAQLGAAAGQAYASTQQAVGQFNTQLTQLDAQATGQRSMLYSQNAAARSQAQHVNDTHNMAMLDHLNEQVILHSPAAMNNYQVQREIFGDTIKTEQGVAMLDLYRQNQKSADMQGMLGILGTVVQAIA